MKKKPGHDPRHPKISVCIPTYNRPLVLCEAIDSVLTNGMDNVEVVVSDDAADPEIRKKIAAYKDKRIRYYANKQHGIRENWTNAVKHARAPYLMKLDDDDLLLPGFLQKACDFLDAHRDVSIVFSGFVVRRENGVEKVRIDNDFFEGRSVVDGFEYASALLLNKGYPENHKSAGIFRRNALKTIEYFNLVSVDVFFTIALASMGNVGYIHEPLFVYRFHSTPNEGMGWRPLYMSMESLNNLFDLKPIASDPRWQAIRSESLRTLRLIIPLMYIGNHYKTQGRRSSMQTAKRLVQEFPEIEQNRMFWPAVRMLYILPRFLYQCLVRYYSRHNWPRTFLNFFLEHGKAGQKHPRTPRTGAGE